MELRIAESFTDSLGRLTGEEQKAVKMTAFDLQMNIASPGLSFHKLDKARDKNFWSLRVNSDIRIIVHKSAKSILLCYVDHHDKAYGWAERRRIDVHPTTGAAQLVEIRETVQEIFIPKYVEVPKHKPLIFAKIGTNDLLKFGVPADWIDEVRAANEDSLFYLADHLPKEAAEALLEIATGGRPLVEAKVVASNDPFNHPDALRRFRVMGSVEELEAALNSPWAKWLVFLHPEQEKFATQKLNGPARISGPAGTGKTIVALHRAVSLAKRDLNSKVLVTTFSENLVASLQERVQKLAEMHPEVKNRIQVSTLDGYLLSMKNTFAKKLEVISEVALKALFESIVQNRTDLKLKASFLVDEFLSFVDPWQISSFAEYEETPRIGRKGRLSPQQKREVWNVCEEIELQMNNSNFVTFAGMYKLACASENLRSKSNYTHFVVDEAQDLSIPQLRFLAFLGNKNREALFFAGDTHQRIFQQPFSWKKLGIDVRGRSKSLTVNYRTSHQIRAFADGLIDRESIDEEGESAKKETSISIFNGPTPVLQSNGTTDEEVSFVANWLFERISEGFKPNELAIFVRSAEQKQRATASLILLKNLLGTKFDCDPLKIITMHEAKGLEFRGVVVMGCDDEVVPLQSRIESATNESDLEEVYRTERHLLYVALTRARDVLAVSWVGAGSEFLGDVRGKC